jgi:hypothetical protein
MNKGDIINRKRNETLKRVIDSKFKDGFNEGIKTAIELIETHKDCKNYHRIDNHNKKEYLLCSCLETVKRQLLEKEIK